MVLPSEPFPLDEDIKHLLQMELAIRFKEDEVKLFKQVDEKTKQFQKRFKEYRIGFAKYCKLLKLCATRDLMESSQAQNKQPALEKTKVMLQAVKLKLEVSMSDLLDTQELETCLKNLDTLKLYPQLKLLQQEMAANKEAVQDIQGSIKAVESMLEMATIQGLDGFVEEFNVEYMDNNK